MFDNDSNKNEYTNDESINTPLDDNSNENEIVEIDSEATVNEKKKVNPLYVTNIVVNSIFYVFIFILLLFSISQIAGSKENKVKNVFGLGYEVVMSNSMSPTFEADDLIWVNTGVKKSKLKIGKIVTFYDTVSQNPYSNQDGFLNTHRIVDLIYDSNGKVSAYVLQGDIWNDTEYDYDSLTDDEKVIAQYSQQYVQVVRFNDIKAIYTGKWSGAGNFVNWLSNPKKGFVLVIIFTGLFLVFEMFMVIKNVMEIRTAKLQEANEAEKEEMKKSLDEEREKMKAELLAQLRAEQAAAAKENAETKPNDEKDITDSSEKGDEEK